MHDNPVCWNVKWLIIGVLLYKDCKGKTQPTVVYHLECFLQFMRSQDNNLWVIVSQGVQTFLFAKFQYIYRIFKDSNWKFKHSFLHYHIRV